MEWGQQNLEHIQAADVGRKCPYLDRSNSRTQWWWPWEGERRLKQWHLWGGCGSLQSIWIHQGFLAGKKRKKTLEFRSLHWSIQLWFQSRIQSKPTGLPRPSAEKEGASHGIKWFRQPNSASQCRQCRMTPQGDKSRASRWLVAFPHCSLLSSSEARTSQVTFVYRSIG